MPSPLGQVPALAGVWLPGVWEASKSPGVPCYPGTSPSPPPAPVSRGLPPQAPCFQLAFLLSSLHSGPFLLPLCILGYTAHTVLTVAFSQTQAEEVWGVTSGARVWWWP